MSRKKDLIKIFDENTIENLFDKQKNIKESPEYLNKNIYNIIDNYRSKKQNNIFSFKLFSNNYFKFGLAVASAFVIIILSILILQQSGIIFNRKNICVVKSMMGKVQLSSIKNDKLNLIHQGDKLKEKSIIKTSKDSFITLQIGEKSNLKVNENSNIQLKNIYKKNETENTVVFMEYGSVKFNPHTISKDSSFYVETEDILITVVGTEFLVNIDKNKNTEITVYEGKISIKNNLKIKKLNKNLKIQFEKEINSEKYFNKDEKIIIYHEDIKNYKLKTKKIIDLLHKNITNNKYQNKQVNEIFKNLEKELNEVKNLNHNLYKNKEKIAEEKTEKNEEENKIIKLSNFPKLKLTEKNTYISSANKYLFLSSESNKKIYSIDLTNGKLLWEYSDEKINKISMGAYYYRESIFFGSPDKLFRLNYNGKLISITDIKDGSIYWQKPVILNKNMLIPGGNYIYKFDGNEISSTNIILNNSGQLYFSTFNNKLLCNDLINRKIYIINYENNQIEWTSEQLEDRAFMSPVKIGNKVFIADSSNYIYKFNTVSQETKIEKISIDKGITTQIIYKNNYLYFIANDGWFYKLNINNFNKPIKISKICKNPDPNKFLSKNLLIENDKIYFSCDTGKIFIYNINNSEHELLQIKDKPNQKPLIGSPVKYKDSIYFVDTDFNIYKLKI